MEDPLPETEIERNGAEVQIKAKPGGGAESQLLEWKSK